MSHEASPTPHVPAPNACSIPCDLCGSSKVRELSLRDRDGSYLRTVVCEGCGLVFSDPRPQPEDVKQYYEKDYRLDYKAQYEPKLTHTYRAGRVAVGRYREMVWLLKPDWEVLDFGAGGGELVYVLRAMKLDASGFEPNEGYARFASEKLDLPVIQGFFQSVAVEPESKDLVTMFHVLEHLDAPTEALRRVRGWLKPGGHLWIEVPSVESRATNPHRMFHRAHLFNFSLATLKQLGRKAGFDIVHEAGGGDDNITVVLKRREGAATESIAENTIPGNCDRIAASFAAHSYLKYLLRPGTHVRSIRKALAHIKEWRGCRGTKSPKEVLDRLIARELPQMNADQRG